MKLLKRILCVILTILAVCFSSTVTMANNAITVEIDGKQIDFDVQPQLINDRTMVPLRAIFEAIGATVEWDDVTKTVTSTKGSSTIILTINHAIMYVNGKGVALDSPACIIDGRTLVPVRAISEAFDMEVEWKGETKTVVITSVGAKEENVVKQVNSHPKAFEQLRKIIIQNGSVFGSDRHYSLYYKPASNDYGFMISYYPQYNDISIYHTADAGSSYKYGVLLTIYYDRDPQAFATYETSMGNEYELFGSFPSGELFTVIENTMPLENQELFESAINATFELMNMDLYEMTGLSFSDFGMYYHES